MGFLSLSRLHFDELIFGIFFKGFKTLTFNKKNIVEILLKKLKAVLF